MNTCCTPENKTVDTEKPRVQPRYSVGGDQNTYAINVELPGVKKDDIDIQLDGDILSVNARRHVTAPAEWKPLHRELREFDYALRLKINAPVDESRFTAHTENGVLTLLLPVKEAAKPRRIEVN